MWGKRVRKQSFFVLFLRMCLSLFDYQSKASRYRKGLTDSKNRVTTNQKHKIDTLKPKKKHEHKIKGNHQITKRKSK